MSQPADDSVIDQVGEAIERKDWEEAYGLLSEADDRRGSNRDASDARGGRVHGG